MKIKSMGFIGGGRITRIILQALKQQNALPEDVLVSDPNDEMKKKVQVIDTTTIQCTDKNTDILNVDLLFLSVHPPVMKEVAVEINGKIGLDTIIVSLVPVFSIERLSMMLGRGVTKLVRMIPNAPSIIQKGYNPVVYSGNIGIDEKQQLKRIFNCLGETPEVDESKLEAYAVVTAMGPTYFWPQWMKLQMLGNEFGLSSDELHRGMAAMLSGSVELMYHSNLSAEEVMDLIPVYPLKEKQAEISGIFENSLRPLYQKLKGIIK